MFDVTVLYFEGCPNWHLADERLRELAEELGLELRHQRVETPEAAVEQGRSSRSSAPR